MSMIVQIGLLVFTLISTCISLVYLFESRSSSIPENRFKITRTTSRIVYYFLIYLFTAPSLLLNFQIPENQEDALLESLKIIPCPTREFFTEQVVVALSDPFLIKVILIIGIPVLGTFIFFHIFFYVASCIYYLYVSPSNRTSSRTRKIQKSFFIGILIQTGIPIVILAAPYIIMATALLLDRLSQGLTNSVMIIFGIHGILESVCIILVHRSYRQSFLKILGEYRAKSSEFNFDILITAESFQNL
ncbi:hypothetical protein CRE_20004 [Caenorhabditis remanei]|uniref:Serpentine Receptor, class H n=1 Tax=Caenorhabditis remanei TaxID=31234 RepID=E3NCF9_CAERE|nr:hypothetical protein CRE_20004 [Caenorhabditis remanei]